LKDVLENFDDLLDICEARAVEMEEALEPHAILSKTQRCLRIFFMSTRSKRRPCSIRASSGTPTSRAHPMEGADSF
jgi:hypothetical protein